MNEIPESNSAKLQQALKGAQSDMDRYAVIYEAVFQTTRRLNAVHGHVLTLLKGFHEIIGSTPQQEDEQRAQKERAAAKKGVPMEVIEENIATAQVEFEVACGEILDSLGLSKATTPLSPAPEVCDTEPK
jgi:hypothetical protein